MRIEGRRPSRSQTSDRNCGKIEVLCGDQWTEKWLGGFLSVRGDSSCSVMSDLKICLRDVFGIVLRFSPSTKTSYAGSEESETNFCSNPIHDDRKWVCGFFSNHCRQLFKYSITFLAATSTDGEEEGSEGRFLNFSNSSSIFLLLLFFVSLEEGGDRLFGIAWSKWVKDPDVEKRSLP